VLRHGGIGLCLLSKRLKGRTRLLLTGHAITMDAGARALLRGPMPQGLAGSKA
jgi:hypothetical protein